MSVRQSLFTQHSIGASTIDMYPAALGATEELFDLYAEYIDEFQSGELEFADYVAKATELQLIGAQIEQVNALFTFLKTYEKGLQSGITA